MFQLSVYGLVFFVFGVLLCLPGLFLRGRDSKYPEMRLCRYFLLWALLCMGISLMLTDPPLKIFFHELKFAGIVVLPLIILSLNLRLVERRLSRNTLIVLSIVPLVTLIMLVTNSLHHLFRDSIGVVIVDGIAYIMPDSGIFYYLHTAYSFLLIVAATVILLIQQFKTPLFYRRWRWIVIISGFFLIMLNILLALNVIVDYGDFVLLAFVPVYYAEYYALFLYHPIAMIQQERNTVIHTMEDSVLFFGIDGRLLDANAGARKNHGVTDADIGLLTAPEFFSRIAGSDAVPASLSERVELRLKAPYKGIYMLSDKSVLDEKYRYTGRVLMLHDVTGMKNTLSELEHTLSHDALTGLLSRQSFREHAAAVEGGFCLVCAGINNMKLINTVFGFGFGDEVIRFVASALSKACPADGLCARMGGDEFMLLLPGCTITQAMTVAEELSAACAECRDFFLPITLCTSCTHEPSGHGPEVIQAAIQSCVDEMYRNKLFSRGRDFRGILDGLVSALSSRGVALRRVKELCRRLAEAAGCDSDTTERLELLADMAEIGFLSIDQDLIDRRGSLNNDEWASWKLHVERGFKIARQTPALYHIADDILSHHERFDGLGYPRRLKGGDIPFGARVYALCEAYASWCDKGRGPSYALKKIAALSGSRFDPELVALLQRAEADGGDGICS